jgi:hypothetical protein
MFVSTSGKGPSGLISLLLLAAGVFIIASAAATRATAASNADTSKPKLEVIVLSPRTFTGLPGATQQLAVSGIYSNGAKETLQTSGQTFTSSNTAVATVSAAGVVTVVTSAAAGATATIGAVNTATGISTTATGTTAVTVSAPPLVSIALSPPSVQLQPNTSQQLTVTGTYSNGSTQVLAAAAETFSSSNSSVATVSAAGVVSVLAGATVGATATIGATNTASGISTSASSSTVVTVVAPTLVSIALSPLAVQLAPNATQQLTVTGSYSNGSTQVLAPSGEAFTSSNSSVATVNTSGIVTVVPGALVGATSTIGVTDDATGISAMSGQTTVVTATLPSSNSVAAATATALDNGLCNNSSTAIAPFYWEIGDQNGPLASGSVGTTSNGPILATTEYSIASASKMIYGMYVTQVRGAASNLTASDINFLHFTSGYSNMPVSDSESSICPTTDSPDTVNVCLTLKSRFSQYPNEPFSYQVAADIGEFYYSPGHMENHASQDMGLGNVPLASLTPVISQELGAGTPFVYTEPLPSGGVETTAAVYAGLLRSVLNGSLAFHDALGTNPVCTLASSTCVAGYTPLPEEAWDYSIGHWVEDNPATNGDGAFSEGGEFGFYPWIDSTKSYYGVVSHDVPNSAYPTIECGRLIRAAFMTGIQQTGTIPTPYATHKASAHGQTSGKSQ